MNGNGYYGISSLFGSKQCPVKLVFSHNVFGDVFNDTKAAMNKVSMEGDPKVEPIVVFDTISRLLSTRLQTLELSVTDTHMYGHPIRDGK